MWNKIGIVLNFVFLIKQCSSGAIINVCSNFFPFQSIYFDEPSDKGSDDVSFATKKKNLWNQLIKYLWYWKKC